MKNIFIIAVLIVGVVGVFMLFDSDAKNNLGNTNTLGQEQDVISKPLLAAPAFSLKDYDGNTVALSNFAGKNILVNSWAAWCPFCRKELSDFVQIQKEFGDDIVIIAIDRAEPLLVSKKYSDELGVTDDLIFLVDPSDSFYASIGGFSMPETIFVDGDGNIRYHKRGPMTVNEIRTRIKEAFDL